MCCRRNYAKAAWPRHIGRKDFSTTCCAVKNRLGRNGNTFGKIRCAPGLWRIRTSGHISAKFLRWTIAWSVCDVRAGVLRRMLSAVIDRRYNSNHFGFDGHRPPLQKNVRIVTARYQQILGIRFFDGDVEEAIAIMSGHGGFLVAPSGTCFARLREDESYRRAMLAADLAIADSGLMVVLWRLLRGENVQRISGLKYLQQ